MVNSLMVPTSKFTIFSKNALESLIQGPFVHMWYIHLHLRVYLSSQRRWDSPLRHYYKYCRHIHWTKLRSWWIFTISQKGQPVSLEIWLWHRNQWGKWNRVVSGKFHRWTLNIINEVFYCPSWKEKNRKK